MTIADINQEIRDLCDADSTSLTNATLLRRVNSAYEEVVGKLVANSGKWQFGDSNYTSLPTGLQTLVNSQEGYQFASALLNVLAVSVKDQNGLWQPLIPITLDDIKDLDQDAAEFLKTDGRPIYYEKREDFLVLYPAPDNGVSVTLTNGLKTYFQRTADIFTSAQVTTGTKTPGFASPYHVLLAYKAALPHCAVFKKERVPFLNSEIARLEKELLAFYSQKAKDERHALTTEPIAFR